MPLCPCSLPGASADGERACGREGAPSGPPLLRPPFSLPPRLSALIPPPRFTHPLTLPSGTMTTSAPSRRTTISLIILIVVLYLIDQVSKWLIVFNFEPPVYYTDHVSVFDSAALCFDIVRVHNNGVAFGFGNGTLWAPYVFLGVQLAALAFLIVLYRRGFFFSRLLRVAWALILAGVIGNMTDRLLQGFFLPGAEQLSFFENLSRGYVVDFLDVGLPWIHSAVNPDGMYHWPSFNVADSCVCIAAALFLLVSFLPGQRPDEKETKARSRETNDQASAPTAEATQPTAEPTQPASGSDTPQQS